MNHRHFAARIISDFSAATSFLSKPPEGFRILMYHAIGTPALDDRLNLFSLSSKQFQWQMQMLANWKHGSIDSLSESALQGRGRQIAITFDDGYLDNLRVAAPILVELGLPFSVFITSEFIRKAKPGFLSPENLRELANLPGVQIGAHGASHIPLTKCNDELLNSELSSSKHYLEDVLGCKILHMAYPYGAVDRRVRDAALDAGYQLGVCSQAGINNAERDAMLLTRTQIVSLDNQRIFSQKLHGNWDWYRWRSRDPSCQ